MQEKRKRLEERRIDEKKEKGDEDEGDEGDLFAILRRIHFQEG